MVSEGKTGALKMAEVTYPCYWQKKDNSGQWYWIYYSGNGEEIARSSKSYVNRSDCEHAIQLMKNSSGAEVVSSVSEPDLWVEMLGRIGNPIAH